MAFLGGLMLSGKLAYVIETRDRTNALVNVHSPGLTGVIGTQARQHVIRSLYRSHDWLVIDMCIDLQ